MTIRELHGVTLDLGADEDATTDCPVCGGDGFLIGDDDAEVQCEACDGSGRVPSDRQAG
jgi:DnaJ-class molecular chaperone